MSHHWTCRTCTRWTSNYKRPSQRVAVVPPAADCLHVCNHPLQSILTTRVKVLWRKAEVRLSLPSLRTVRSCTNSTTADPGALDARSGVAPRCVYMCSILPCPAIRMLLPYRAPRPCRVAYRIGEASKGRGRGGTPCDARGVHAWLSPCPPVPFCTGRAPFQASFPLLPTQVKTRVWKRFDLRDPHCIKAEYHMLDSVS